ncbi:MAG: hypothetical protein JWN86_458 [Planctomycetota bacterium]|nr:hypothetical protein [Planctomycetota bacterium]
MPMFATRSNKFRIAVEVLQKGRDLVVDGIADDVIDQADDLLDGGYLFNEFLETQGTRLHFLSLLIQQLEQSAEGVEEAESTPPPPPVETKARKPRKPRTKKLPQQASAENAPEDA